MRIKKKTILLLFFVLLAAAAGTGYYLYNKPAVNIEDADAPSVLATDLYRSFITDTATAKKIYTNKILRVTGTVSQLTKNQQQQQLVMLNSGVDGAAVNCTLEGPAMNLQAGEGVSLQGICNGIGEGDPDLGIMGDVYLVRCYLVK
jgi:hypothetical protein